MATDRVEVPVIPRDNLQLGEVLSTEGATGIVREATLNGVPVIAKSYCFLETPEVYGSVVGDEAYVFQSENLAKEARLLFNVQHGNIVRCHGLCVDAATKLPHYIIMERGDTSLSKYLLACVYISEEILAGLCHDVLCGLAYLHARGVAHCDLKLDNVLIFIGGDRPVAKLCDLDLAKLRAPSGDVVVDGGAPFYAAPEASQRSVGNLSLDLFSVGVMVAEILVKHVHREGISVDLDISDRSRLVAVAVANLGPDHYLSPFIQACVESDGLQRWSARTALLYLEQPKFRPLCAIGLCATVDWDAWMTVAKRLVAVEGHIEADVRAVLELLFDLRTQQSPPATRSQLVSFVVEVVPTAPASREVVLAFCDVVRDLVAQAADAAVTFRGCGGIDLLEAYAGQFADDFVVTSACVWVLDSLRTHSDVGNVSASAGPRLTAAGSHSHQRFGTAAASALNGLSSCASASCDTVVKHCHALVAGVTVAPGAADISRILATACDVMTVRCEEELQDACCLLLRAAVFRCVETGLGVPGVETVVACLVTAMSAFPQAERLQERALLAIGALFTHPAFREAYRSLVLRKGGVASIVAAMDHHIGAISVQMGACIALQLLALDSPVNTEVVVRQGALPRVLAAMDRYPVVAGVQDAGCCVLRDVTADCAVGQAAVLETGGLSRIFAAMDHHIDVVGIQVAGCVALGHLSDTPDGSARIVAEGGLRTIFTAMDAHGAVEESGVVVLMSLSSRDEAAFWDGVRCVLAVAGGHVPSADVFTFGCGSAAEAIVALGGAQRLHVVLSRTDPESSFVARLHAFGCLSNLASCSAGNAAIRKVPTCVASMFACWSEVGAALGEPAASSTYCESVCNLAMGPATVPQLLALAVVDTVTEALREHVDNADVAKHGCLALGLIAVSGDEGLAVISSPGSGCLDCVRAAAAAHPDCSDVQQLAAALALLIA